MRCFAFAASTAILFSSTMATAADTWSTPHPGVRYLYRTTSTPRRIVATQIDLCASGVRMRATAPGEKKRTTSSFANLVGAKVAVNADFFSFSNDQTSGLAIGNGEQWSGTKDGTGEGFVAFGDGRVSLSSPSAVVDPPPAWMKEVVSGNLQVLTQGQAVTTDSGDFCTTRHPRTAVGLSEDQRMLVLAVVDGRTSTAVGMKCSELGALMKELGAYDALNLDGGGSSAMFIAGSGVVNKPSDGSERVVANHLGVLATGAGDGWSCNRSFEEAAVDGDAYDSSTTTDVDGDGKADVCARGPEGIQCALSSGASFGSVFDGPKLSDANGWNDITNYATIRMGDINGDGKADICARSDASIDCWLSDGKGFSTSFSGPELSDANDWHRPMYYGTIRMADFNGDGMDDLCARASQDFRCYPSTGTGFGGPVKLDAVTNDGYGNVSAYGTLRMGDINGDGKADMCIRGAEGVTCWPSTGTGWGEAIKGPDWTDAGGWTAIQHWSTIRLADIDGDGMADLCAHAAKGMICHLSTGTGFGPQISGPAWTDESGWDKHRYFSTIRLADIDGDGALDMCARGVAGVSCALWTGDGFGTPFSTGLFPNDGGWDQIQYYSTIRFADIDGDGKADLCARGWSGIECWLSDGAGFSTRVDGPGWSNPEGWNATKHYATIRMAGPKAVVVEEIPDAGPDGAPSQGGSGGSGGSGAGGTAGGAGSLGGAGTGTSGNATDAGVDGGKTNGDWDFGDDSGCGCRLPGSRSGVGGFFLSLVFGLIVLHRARVRKSA